MKRVNYPNVGITRSIYNLCVVLLRFDRRTSQQQYNLIGPIILSINSIKSVFDTLPQSDSLCLVYCIQGEIERCLRSEWKTPDSCICMYEIRTTNRESQFERPNGHNLPLSIQVSVYYHFTIAVIVVFLVVFLYSMWEVNWLQTVYLLLCMCACGNAYTRLHLFQYYIGII